MKQAICITIDEELLSWMDEIVKQSSGKLNRSRLIEQGIKLLKTIEEEKSKGVDVTILGYTPIHIDEKTYKLLEDISKMTNITNMNELLEYLIVGMHVLLKLGIWKFFKPIRELARQVEESYR
jgi:metal-responsive CopG/Arc/MetJ family transcriptional regulator